ncbi:MAG: response regulator receiver sensor hybrid histidine kinase [Alphaproteobacteria bacterium]|nr:response regulator receiver sensor hybrid histidine kinase [Alphaproteobacteria bacterium]
MVSDVLHKILYIEDDFGLARLLQKRLTPRGLEFDIAFTGEEGMACLRNNTYDLILLDNVLPDMNGIDLLDRLQPLDQQPPIILLTASGDERLAVTALEKGAADYAVKDTEQFYIDLLPAIMHAAFTRYKLMHENLQQRQDLEKAWQKAQAANQAKSEFLATMSHEIRTPLNVILGIGNLLDRTACDSKQREMIDVLNTNAAVLLGLVNDILDLSRVESGQIVLEEHLFTSGEILKDMEAMFALDATKKNLQFSIQDNSRNSAWRGDRLRVQQILMNLIGNAIKFTEQGHVRIAADKRNDALHITVEDSGIGISPDKQKTIFSKFVQADQSITRRFGGSGLGLSLSQSFAKMMNGEITVESEPGKGSVFTVILPLPFEKNGAEEIVPIQEEKPAAIDSGKNSGHILLVEDYPANIMIATMMLESMDFTVDVVSSGIDAVKKIQEAGRAYHAILMDIQMQGMDGFEATRQIRALEREKPFRHLIIGATAHALAGDRERCLAAGMDDYISKPIDWDLLKKKVKPE